VPRETKREKSPACHRCKSQRSQRPKRSRPPIRWAKPNRKKSSSMQSESEKGGSGKMSASNSWVGTGAKRGVSAWAYSKYQPQKRGQGVRTPCTTGGQHLCWTDWVINSRRKKRKEGKRKTRRPDANKRQMTQFNGAPGPPEWNNYVKQDSSARLTGCRNTC